MEADKVLIDFSLPNNPDTLKFLKLNQSDKIKAIALGIKFLTSGNHQLQSWDNSQWEGRLEQIKQEKEELILALEEKLNLEHIKRQKLVKTQKEELNSIVESVRNRTESKYLSEIAGLNDKVERLQNKFHLQENEKNPELFNFIWETAKTLCQCDKIDPNFALKYLLNLSRFLGFYPSLEDINKPFFNLLNGTFSNNIDLEKTTLQKEESGCLKALLKND